jgi:hypothetical protein
MTNAIAAGASDLAMVDIMKIGGVTGWLSAMAQAEAAALSLSNHTFVEPSAHVMAVSLMAFWFEYLDMTLVSVSSGTLAKRLASAAVDTKRFQKAQRCERHLQSSAKYNRLDPRIQWFASSSRFGGAATRL